MLQTSDVAEKCCHRLQLHMQNLKVQGAMQSNMGYISDSSYGKGLCNLALIIYICLSSIYIMLVIVVKPAKPLRLFAYVAEVFSVPPLIKALLNHRELQADTASYFKPFFYLESQVGPVL